MKKFMKMFLGLVVLVFSAVSFAEEVEEGKIKEIVVTATRFPTERENVSMDVQVITAEEIKELGVEAFDDVIGRLAPGHLTKFIGGLATFGMRGYKGEAHGVEIKGQILTLVDGHRIGASNLAKMPVDWIERVEIVKGPASTLYGAAAMGGVVNIITKKGKGPVKTTFSSSYGSSSYKESIVSQGEVNENFKYSLTTGYFKQKDYETVKYGKVYNSDQLRKDIGANFTFSPSDDRNLRLGFTYADLTGGYPRWKDRKTYTTFDTDYHPQFDKSRGHTDIEYNHSFLNGEAQYKGTAYYLWDHNEWRMGTVNVDDDVSKYNDYTLGTTQYITYDIPEKNTLVFGITYENLEKKSEARKDGKLSIPYTPAMELTNEAVFVEDTIKFMDERFLLIPGIRYDRFDMKTKQPEDISYIEYLERSESYDHFSPRVGGVYKLTDTFRIRGNVGQAFKSPAPDELAAQYEYESWYGTIRRILGNPDLKPETSMTYEVGTDYSVPSVTFGMSYFYTKSKNRIVSDPGGVEYEGKIWDTYKNTSGTYVQGIDLSVDWEAGKSLELSTPLSVYSRFTYNIDDKDEETGEKLMFLSSYELKSGIRWRATPKLSIFLSNVFVGPQDVWNYGTYPYTREEKGSFNFTDLHFTYMTLKDWEFKAAVNNLFDQDYEWMRGYPMPERNYMLTVGYTF